MFWKLTLKRKLEFIILHLSHPIIIVGAHITDSTSGTFSIDGTTFSYAESARVDYSHLARNG